MGDKLKEVKHTLVLEDRKSILLTGVKKVNSFDTKEIIVDTIKGNLCIKGHEMGIKNLNLHEMEIEIEGCIDVLLYPASRSKEKRKNIWDKLFK
ncbi:MAG: sporulation protein YabP [Eubacteriales bacterium]